MRTLLLTLACVAVLVGLLYGDIYMHNPRGSNNRNCERDDNTRNQNRLFNSQNNAAGGYACPRPQAGRGEIEEKRMYYYVGSVLPITWTHQHACGNTTNCQIIIQYACGSQIRDGTPEIYDPTNRANPRSTATATVSETTKNDPLYGVHEPFEDYKKCTVRNRNRGLYTADQILRGNSAIYTRTNDDGTRYGFECPEERDYYPYWHPSIWRDVVVFTSNTSMCDYYQQESQNVKPRGGCYSRAGVYLSINNPTDCLAGRNYWNETAAWNIPPPECLSTELIATRENHLGQTLFGVMDPTYNWTIPEYIHDQCVVRIRYNISTSEIDWNLNSTHNNYLPLQTDPLVYPLGEGMTALQLAVNTDQHGRIFQDRSYTFSIKPRPTSVSGLSSTSKIYNINVKGKRGNIVDTFPSQEYSFAPDYLNLKGGDWVHFQWTGSDYNPNRAPNSAEGGPPERVASGTAANAVNANSGADRNNIVSISDLAGVFGTAQLSRNYFFRSLPNGEINTRLVQRLAYLDQNLETRDPNLRCMNLTELTQLTRNIVANNAQQTKENAERDPQNCAKLNAMNHTYFDAGLFQVNTNGKYSFMSTRNNNFSNRQQKLVIAVSDAIFSLSPVVYSSFSLALSILTVLFAM